MLECEEWWASSCCGPIGYVLCCRRMRKSSRIQIIWGWLLLAAIATCTVLGFLVYQPDKPFATPSDMRPVIKNFHPLFCEAAKIITPPGSPLTFDAYVIRGELKTDIMDRQIYESNSAFYVDAKEFYFFAFYLLYDSGVSMRHCPKHSLTFYVFRGQNNFKTWKTDSGCEDCYLFKRYIRSGPFDCDVFDMSVAAEDDYFFVYSTDHKMGTWVDIHVYENRSIYDLGESNPVCSNVHSCEVVINDLEEKAVYQVNGYYNLDGNSHPVFTTKCVPRIWSYIIIHGLIVVIVGAVCTVLINKCCKDVQIFPSDRRTEERAPLLNSLLPPSYSTVTLTPPKYEDIVKDFDYDLPSYSDVLNSNIRGHNDVTIQIPNPVASENLSEVTIENREVLAPHASPHRTECDYSRIGEHHNPNILPQNVFCSEESSEQGTVDRNVTCSTNKQISTVSNVTQNENPDTIVSTNPHGHSNEDSLHV